jgi:hypothetical protein
MLSRHVSGESSEPWVEGHLARCVRCAAECTSLQRIVTQARRLQPPAEMSAAARRAIGARLLTAGPERRISRAWRWSLLAAAMAAVVVAAVTFGARGLRRATPGSTVAEMPRLTTPGAAAPDRSPPAAQRPSVATLRAIGAARFTRVQPRPDEVVRLDDGTIVLTVERLTAGERFRVRTDDAEVEVRGTRFQVSASRGRLTAVSVSSGRVEVRSPGGGHVLLDPGDEWVRGTDEPETARPATLSPSAPSSSRRSRPSPPSFDQAWSLLRQGDARQAAALFGAVVRSAGDRDIAEDALYWWAVATAKAGDRAEAQALFERFLRRFPAASRSGEAAAALGWLYVEDGRLVDARSAFERAARDPSPAVRASAQRGLQRTAEH